MRRSSLTKSVLIVDDSPVIRKTLRRVLETQTNCMVVGEAIDGQEAIEKAQDLRPDIVTLDIAMPIMNGFEVARRLSHTFPRMAILVFTSYQSAELTKLALAAGAHAVMMKSQPRALVDYVHSLCRKFAA